MSESILTASVQPKEIVHLVRRGYALATPEQVEVVRNCRELEVVGERWIPRWALETLLALQERDYSPEQLREAFARGRDGVLGELAALARAGNRVVEPRVPYRRSAVDQLTEAALRMVQEQHRDACDLCKSNQPCLDRDDLEEELAAMFPADRRRKQR